MSPAELAMVALAATVATGFVVWGLLAWSGGWPWLRRQMLADPEGHRHVGALPLGLVGVPVVGMVLVPPGPDGGFTAVHWVLLMVMAVLLVAVVALALDRPAALTRVLTPRWLLVERAQAYGELDPAGRPVALLPRR